MTTAAWIKCPLCDEFWCVIHNQHTAGCACPPIEDWDHDPYGEDFIMALLGRANRRHSGRTEAHSLQAEELQLPRQSRADKSSRASIRRLGGRRVSRA